MIDIPHFEALLQDRHINVDMIGVILSYSTDMEKAQISEYFREHVGQLPISQEEVTRIEAGMFEVRAGPELEFARAINDFLNNPDAVWDPDMDNGWGPAPAGGGEGPPGGDEGPPGGGEGP